ncbi:uncharacterized protein G2W53_014705 [Senna tora]|uniref:Uncharacterized protein n=1 Tax=Senna tora TaxID=362788 RepID=A0A834WU36_9FABA|nr:uncharacterized protein G2W53_014705 [Senna tora]
MKHIPGSRKVKCYSSNNYKFKFRAKCQFHQRKGQSDSKVKYIP